MSAPRPARCASQAAGTAGILRAAVDQATRLARLLRRVPARLDCRAMLRRVVVLDERRRVRDGK